MDKELYIGVMSGTSLDGIDIALCEIDDTSCKLIKAEEYQFDQTLKTEILDVISNSTTLKQIGTIDKKLGLLYANAINNFIQTNNLNKQSIKAIGLHGQTLWHEPEGDFPFSMQLGDANTLVAKTGIKTVSDFRGMDIANGGQGAPFAPAFHQFLFASLSGNIAVVNIGGMANITLLGKELKGWDTGCGNVLLDMWINQTQEKPYDKDGAFAKSGTLNEELLKSMLEDAYFKKRAPKSTGREYFNQTWLANYLPIFDTISENDIQRTLLELTAKSIANDINTTQTNKLIVCGGGVKNGFLMQRLDELTQCEIIISDSLGVSSEYLEAMAFAWFAYKRVHEEVAELHSVTGAKKDSLLGAIYG
ncbi:MAG: anhydro-N-acetylmuramic acid kinase [Sulfurimonas sp.]